MATNDLTSTASVRSVLGVSEKEIRDDVLLNPVYSTLLSENLYEISPTITTDYATTAAIAEASRTRTEQRFVDLMQAYAAYHIANQCMGSISMFAPKTIKDSRSELTRSDDPYSALRSSVPGALAVLRQSLLKVYALINPSATITPLTARVRVTSAPLATDPVTG